MSTSIHSSIGELLGVGAVTPLYRSDELHAQKHVVCGGIHHRHRHFHNTGVVSTSAQIEFQLGSGNTSWAFHSSTSRDKCLSPMKMTHFHSDCCCKLCAAHRFGCSRVNDSLLGHVALHVQYHRCVVQVGWCEMHQQHVCSRDGRDQLFQSCGDVLIREMSLDIRRFLPQAARQFSCELLNVPDRVLKVGYRLEGRLQQ